MTRITISLRDQERSALRELAEMEFREPQAQAALIIRRELERRGFLAISKEPSTAVIPSQGKAHEPQN